MGSTNTQTGPMPTIWYLLQDTPPNIAVRDGLDEAICGGCLRRPSLRTPGVRGCYVMVFRAPLAIWKNTKDKPADLDHCLYLLRRTHNRIRFGGYGDPVAVPLDTHQAMLAAARTGHTGYTSQWMEECAQEYRSVLMASVHTVELAREAQRRGWRTYRTISQDAPGPVKELGEVWCPTAKNPLVTCNICGKCDGGNAKVNYVAPEHGNGVSKHGAWLKHHSS